MSLGSAQKADRVLLGSGNGDRREQGTAVRQRWRAVDGHDAGDLESDLAKVVNVPRRLKIIKKFD